MNIAQLMASTAVASTDGTTPPTAAGADLPAFADTIAAVLPDAIAPHDNVPVPATLLRFAAATAAIAPTPRAANATTTAAGAATNFAPAARAGNAAVAIPAPPSLALLASAPLPTVPVQARAAAPATAAPLPAQPTAAVPAAEWPAPQLTEAELPAVTPAAGGRDTLKPNMLASVSETAILASGAPVTDAATQPNMAKAEDGAAAAPAADKAGSDKAPATPRPGKPAELPLAEVKTEPKAGRQAITRNDTASSLPQGKAEPGMAKPTLSETQAAPTAEAPAETAAAPTPKAPAAPTAPVEQKPATAAQTPATPAKPAATADAATSQAPALPAAEKPVAERPARFARAAIEPAPAKSEEAKAEPSDEEALSIDVASSSDAAPSTDGVTPAPTSNANPAILKIAVQTQADAPQVQAQAPAQVAAVVAAAPRDAAPAGDTGKTDTVRAAPRRRNSDSGRENLRDDSAAAASATPVQHPGAIHPAETKLAAAPERPNAGNDDGRPAAAAPLPAGPRDAITAPATAPSAPVAQPDAPVHHGHFAAAVDAAVGPAAPAPAATVTQAAAPMPAAAASPVVTARAGQIGRELGVEIARRVSAGKDELVVRLDPEHMGRIEVRMQFDDSGTLRAVVQADSPAALDLLRRDSADLARSMTDAGVRADSQSFKFDARTGGEGGQPRQQQPQAQRQPEIFAENGVPLAEEAIDQRRVRASGTVDVIA